MLKNVRRYFRYDVDIYYQILKVEGDAVVDPRLTAALTSDALLPLTLNKKALRDQLYRLEKGHSKLLPVLEGFARRLEFYEWLLHGFAKGKNPRYEPDFAMKLKVYKGLAAFQSTPGLKISKLLDALNESLTSGILTLLKIIQTAMSDRVFLFPTQPVKTLNPNQYVTNLEALSQKGILPLQTLETLVENLNIQNQLLNLLIEVNQPISDLTNWKKQPVNLSAGGLAFISQEPYEKFTVLDCLFMLNQKMILIRGKVVNQFEMRKGNFKVMVDFQMPEESLRKQIKDFLQAEEVAEALEWSKNQQVHSA